MSQGRLLVACDFGTTTFRALVTEERQNGDLGVVAWGQEPAEGFRDGDFVDLRAGSDCIARAVRAAETAADVDITGFTYNISGSHLRSVFARGQIRIVPGPRPIKATDLAAVIAKARSLTIPFDHQILAVNPIEYRVDRVGGILDPSGRIGSQLEVEAHLITGSRSVVRNIENAIGTAGYSGAGGAVDVLAAAAALLLPEEKQAGVLLVDVGGAATGWALFRNGHIVGNGMVPWGGRHLTADLAHGLRVTLEQAEQIKQRRGVALRSLEAEISTDVLFSADEPGVTGGLLAAIIEPRLEEIFSLVKSDLGDARLLSSLGGGLVLTGGGARCRGSELLAEEVFGVPTQNRFLPPGLHGAARLPAGQWATAVGLSLWVAGAEPARQTERRTPRPSRGMWGRLRRLIGPRRGGQRMAAEG
jgi:cell division protein FtsA